MRDLLRRLFAILDRQESPVSRGMNLLRKNLMPAQLRQHDSCHYFDVIGGKANADSSPMPGPLQRGRCMSV